MDAHWIFILLLLLAAGLSDTNTWSPFQSDQVKEICAHMTKAERRAAVKRSTLWGILIGVVPAAIALVLGIVVFRSALVVMILCLLMLPVIALVLSKKCFPHVVKSQQDFLASTQWAQSQGIKANEIQLYKWQA